MKDIVIATSEADARAAEAVEQHHAQMAGTLAIRVEALLSAAARQEADVAREAKRELVVWAQQELVPHALAEETAMYPAAHRRSEGRLLVEGMLAEHKVITDLVAEIASTEEPVRAAASAKALLVTFESHLAKENELILPLLTAAADVSVADLLGGMHELLGGESHTHDDQEAESGRGGHDCGCGEAEAPGYPELDARAVPHSIRHATIFGALAAVRPGDGMILVAPHDPTPLLAQIEQREPGMFEIGYLERGPEAWRLTFVRRTAA